MPDFVSVNFKLSGRILFVLGLVLVIFKGIFDAPNYILFVGAGLLIISSYFIFIVAKQDEKVVVCENDKRRREVEIKKKGILELMKKQGRITNDEVQEMFKVSDATATRYLQELENDGKIKQVGMGRHTYYELVR